MHYVSYRDRLGLITANATTPYILNFFELAETGALVIELPAGPTAGGVSDFWQREFGVLGEMGPDAGRGGKHLVVPPGQDPPDDVEGYNVLRSTGMNVMFGFRTLDPDPAHSKALVDAAPNVTRVTVEGSTGVDEWLKVTIQPRGPQVLTFERVPFATAAAG